MSDPSSRDENKRSPMVLPILGAIAMLAIIGVMLYIGNRLETIEEQLAFRPPQASPDATTSALPGTDISKGRTVYVPAYSHIYSHGGNAYLLEITLSVRNTDPESPIRIQRVRYFDSDGRRIREFDEVPIILAPLQTAAYLVEKTDIEGGSGANFIVEWAAEEAVSPPVIEAIMIGVGDGYNLSFVSRGEAIGAR